MTFTASAVVIAMMLGVMGLITAQEAWLSWGRGRGGHHRWTAWWGLLCVTFLFGRMLQRAAVEPAIALFAARVQLAAGLFIGVAGLLILRAAVGHRPVSWVAAGAIASGAVLGLLGFATDQLVVGAAVPYTDPFGSSFFLVRFGRLTPLIVAHFVVVGALCVRTARQSGALRKPPLWRVVVVALVGCGINDVLLGLGVVHTTFVLEYGLTLASVVVIWRDALNAESAHLDLERAVAARTRELRAEEARFRRLTDATLEGIIVYANGRVADVNPAASRMLGARGALAGLPVAEIFPAALRANVAALIAGETASVDATFKDDGREPVEVELLRAPHADDLPGSGVLALRDVTESKRLEAHLARSERLVSLGSLAAGAAHEINNPLACVVGNLDLSLEELAATRQNQPMFDALREARDAGERIREIVADLMSLVRTEGRKTAPLDLRTVVRSAVKLARHELKHRARVEEHFDEVPPVVGDQGRLIQVVVNLLVNASHALDEATFDRNVITLTVTSRGSDVVLEVGDNGHGIPPELIDRVFDPFVTTKGYGRGTGLGLAISHGIVHDAGGTISVESRVSVGTTFRMTLPAVPGAEVESVISTPVRSTTAAKGKRVLVIDDDAQVARLFSRGLREHEVTTADGGRAGVEACLHGDFDIVFCDLMMPEITGPQLYGQILEARPDLADRFVFMTGGAFTEGAADFLAESTRPLLAKPFTLPEVRQLVERAPPR